MMPMEAAVAPAGHLPRRVELALPMAAQVVKALRVQAKALAVMRPVVAMRQRTSEAVAVVLMTEIPSSEATGHRVYSMTPLTDQAAAGAADTPRQARPEELEDSTAAAEVVATLEAQARTV